MKGAVDEIFFVKVEKEGLYGGGYDYVLCFIRKANAEDFLKDSGFILIQKINKQLIGSFKDILLRRARYTALAKYRNPDTDTGAYLESLHFLGKK